MLLGALHLEAELHKRRLSLLKSVITSDNECLKGLVQRQLACSLYPRYEVYRGYIVFAFSVIMFVCLSVCL